MDKVIVQIFSDHKKLRNGEKHFIKITQPYLLQSKKGFVFYSLTIQTDRQNIYRKVAYIKEECLMFIEKISPLY